jgi:hypothetical protein
MPSNKYTQKQFEQDLQSLEQLIGGKKDYNGTYRNFKIVELNGKVVDFDYGASIKENQTPLNAAKKLLKSICLSMGLKGMKKLQCNVTFVIKETTQGSKKNMYGPYKGKYIKYTPEEAKKAKASGIQFKMKPIVKLSKKNSPMKGGLLGYQIKDQYVCSYCGHKHSIHPSYSAFGSCGGCGKKEGDEITSNYENNYNYNNNGNYKKLVVQFISEKNPTSEQKPLLNKILSNNMANTRRERNSSWTKWGHNNPGTVAAVTIGAPVAAMGLAAAGTAAMASGKNISKFIPTSNPFSGMSVGTLGYTAMLVGPKQTGLSGVIQQQHRSAAAFNSVGL